MEKFWPGECGNEWPDDYIHELSEQVPMSCIATNWFQFSPKARSYETLGSPADGHGGNGDILFGVVPLS
jgi:hypothetical protein